MRLVPTLLVTLVLLAPCAALAGTPVECARLRHQLAHFGAMLERSESMESEMWAYRFAGQIDVLEERQARVCPDDRASVVAMEQMRALLKLAAQGAITFFSGGVF